MNIQQFTIDSSDARRLLGAASGDAALLYIYLRCGNDPATAEQSLNLPQGRLSCAMATLRQLGLWQEEKRTVLAVGERPNYSEKDVLQSLDTDPSFRRLYGEIQRRLGRQLNTEELKVILSLVRYLGLPADVIYLLVSHCVTRSERRYGPGRRPTMRQVEKEGYYWARLGLFDQDSAAAYLKTCALRDEQMGRYMQVLGLGNRRPVESEERYIRSWMDMGFDAEAVALAYDKTVFYKKELNWRYLNGILRRWDEQGWHTAEEIRRGDGKKPTAQTAGKSDLDKYMKW